MSRSARSYRLALDGDHLERTFWSVFIRDQFPAYELFWIHVVVPTTGRPNGGLHFMPDDQLKAADLPTFNVYLSQLHYSVLWHLVAARNLLGRLGGDPESFVNFILRLSAATDCADELLERHNDSSPPLDPWNEKGRIRQGFRRAWRNVHPELRALHDYRNHLVHGGALISIDTPVGRLFPRIEMVGKYADWRNVTDRTAGPFPPPDFEHASVIARNQWDEVVGYLQAHWIAMVRDRGIPAETLPDIDTPLATDATSEYVSTSMSPPMSATFIPPEWLNQRPS